jgi:hypothetical protein
MFPISHGALIRVLQPGLTSLSEMMRSVLVFAAIASSNLDSSIRNIRNLEKDNSLGAWIALNTADAGIRSDYADYRAHHRQHLIDYINTYLIR